MAEVTTDEIKAIVGIVSTVGDVIRECGQIPSGHLYARLCGQLQYHDYMSIIDVLQRAKLIEVAGSQMITWVGPEQVNKVS